MVRQVANLLRGERVERDGPQQADGDAARARQFDRGFQDAAHDAVAHQDDLGIVGAPAFVADLIALGLLVLGFELADVALQVVGLQVDGTDQIGARSPRCPCTAHSGGGGKDGAGGEFHGLHHLADEAIGQHDRGIAVAVGQVEGEGGEVGHLLDGIRRQHEGAVVAVAAAFDDLVVVALLGGDVAEAGTGAHDVGDDAGEFRAGQVAEAFLHQADAGTAGGGHAAHAGRGAAVQHIDGGDFAFGLDEDSAGAREVEGGGLGDLAGRGDRVAVEGAASGQDGGLDDGFIAFGELFLHGGLLGGGQPEDA